MRPALKERYKISYEMMACEGDEHLEKLFDLLKISRGSKPKKTPVHTMRTTRVRCRTAIRPASIVLAFFPSNARWPGRLSSRKDNCILQIQRIKAVATSIMTTICLQKRTKGSASIVLALAFFSTWPVTVLSFFFLWCGRCSILT